MTDTLERTSPERMALRPPLEPLFLLRWTRAIVSTAVAMGSLDGPPDVQRIVSVLARSEALVAMPRMRTPTLRFGLQLLIDTSEAMTPYARDAAVLANRIEMIAGTGSVKTLFFRGNPAEGVGSGAPQNRTPYTPPASSMPVLVLTDLGIQRPYLDPDWASPREWLEFATTLRRAGCPVTAFVPYPAPDGLEAWSARLRSLPGIVRRPSRLCGKRSPECSHWMHNDDGSRGASSS